MFCYDTLETPFEENARQLKEYIDYVKEVSGSSKVNLVSHSQGGLVSRYYIQELGGYSNVNNFVMVGVPNKGVVFTYSIWEGGIGDSYGVVGHSIDTVKAKWTTDFLIALITKKNDDKGKWSYIRALKSSCGLQGMLPTLDYIEEYYYNDLSLQTKTRVYPYGYPKSKILEKLNSAESLKNLGLVNEHLNNGVTRLRVSTILNTGTETTYKYNIYKDPRNRIYEIDESDSTQWAYGYPYISTKDVDPFDVTWQGDGTVLINSIMLDQNICNNIILEDDDILYNTNEKGEKKIVGHQDYFTNDKSNDMVLKLLQQ